MKTNIIKDFLKMREEEDFQTGFWDKIGFIAGIEDEQQKANLSKQFDSYLRLYTLDDSLKKLFLHQKIENNISIKDDIFNNVPFAIFPAIRRIMSTTDYKDIDLDFVDILKSYVDFIDKEFDNYTSAVDIEAEILAAFTDEYSKKLK